MDAKYSDIFRLRVSDYTCYDTLAPHAILDIIQDVSGKHAANYNMAFEDLITNNQIWVIVRVKYKVLEYMPLYSSIKAITWPKEKGLVDFDREIIFTSLDESKTYIKASTKWVIIDSNTRNLIPAKRIDYKLPQCNEAVFDEKISKLYDFDIANKSHYRYEINFMDIDHNNHVNNIRYAMMIMNALKLKKDEIIDEFQMDFVHEIKDVSYVDLYYYKENNIYYVKAISNEKINFISKITLK